MTSKRLILLLGVAGLCGAFRSTVIAAKSLDPGSYVDVLVTTVLGAMAAVCCLVLIVIVAWFSDDIWMEHR